MGRRYIIEPNGKLSIASVNAIDEFEELYAIIGCERIEHVNVFWNGKYEHMFVDEEGLLKRLEVNVIATAWYWQNSIAHEPHGRSFDLFNQFSPIAGIAVLYEGLKWE